MRAAYESPPQAPVAPIHIGDSNLMCDQAWRRPTRCLEIVHQTRQGVAAPILDSIDDQQPPRAKPKPAACVARATAVHPVSRQRDLDRRLKARFRNQEDPQADAWSSTTAGDLRQGARNQNQNCSGQLRQAQTMRGLNADQAKAFATMRELPRRDCDGQLKYRPQEAARVDQVCLLRARGQVDPQPRANLAP